MTQWKHSSGVTVLTFDAAGVYLVSGAEDGTVAAWNVETRKLLDKLSIHDCRITQVDILADWNGYAVSCDVNHNVIQWRLNSGEVARKWSGASKMLLASNNARYVVGSTGNQWFVPVNVVSLRILSW